MASWRELEKQLEAEAEQLAKKQAQSPLLKEEVDEEDIAQVVSRWTGIPLTEAARRRDAEAAASGGGTAPARDRPGRSGDGRGGRGDARARRV